MAAKTAEMSPREARRAYNIATYGTNIPKSEDIKLLKETSAKRKVEEEALQSGATPEEARAFAASTGIGSATPRLDRSAYLETQRQKGLAENPDPNLQGFKSYGDKSLSDARAAVRKLTGQAPLARSPEEFTSQLVTSQGYGEKSGLLTPTGRAKAYASAAEAGLSPEQAKAQIESVADLLKGTRDKGKFTKEFLSPSNAPDYSTGAFKPAAVTPTVTPAAPTAPKVTPTAPEVSPTATPEVDTETEMPANFAEAYRMFGPKGGIGPAVGAASRKASIAAQGAALLNKTDALGRLNIAAVGRAADKGAELLNAKTPAQIKEAARLVREGLPALRKSVSLAAPLAEVGGKATPFYTAASEVLGLTDAERQLANVPAELKAAAKTARGAKTAAALVKGTTALARLAPLASKVSKYAKPLQVIDPALQGIRYMTDEKFREQQLEDTLAGYDKGLGYTVGRAVLKGTPYNPLANPVATLASMGEAPLEARNRLAAAKGELALSRQGETQAAKKEALFKSAREKVLAGREFTTLPTEEKKRVEKQSADLLRELRTKKLKK